LRPRPQDAAIRLPYDICAPVPLREIALDGLEIATPPLPGFTTYWRGERLVGATKALGGETRHEGEVRPGGSLPTPPSASPPSASISVVICTRDRPDALDRCLASFTTQTLRPTELIVVDNASQDGRTRETALAHGVRYVREDRLGLDIARNTGATAATSEFLAYTDDDTVLHRTWLERLVAAFDTPDIWAVTGQVLPAELETVAQCLFEAAWGLGKGFVRRDYDRAFYEATRRQGCPTWEIGAGANMAFRRTVFDRVGGFDERLDVGAAGCSGDSEYWYRILHAGGVCRYEPTAVVYHFHRRDMDALKRQVRAYMRGHAAALLVQYERTGEIGNLRRLFGALPAYYLRALNSRLRGSSSASNFLLGEEVRGALEGIAYYFSSRRPASVVNTSPR
jgi:GT2 family glycosyltransferase